MKKAPENTIKKPKDWPANAVEGKLDSVLDHITLFCEQPSYKNREVLISLVTNHDLNQMSMRGMVRTTEYEVAIMNTLYGTALLHQINAVKSFLYELIGLKTRLQKILSMNPIGAVPLGIEAYDGLFPPLYLYYATYQKYTVEKSMDYADQLTEYIKNSIQYVEKLHGEERKSATENLTRMYITLVNDISYFRSTKRTGIWAFTREQLRRIFHLAAQLCALNGDSPMKKPLRGVLMTSISNYVLKSRNNYNTDYICKYVSPDVARASVKNGQIWLSRTEYLNDEREQRIVPELFLEDGWYAYPWMKNIDFSTKRTYYVSSFCKEVHSVNMSKNYGSCIYGYKDDRMADILAPIFYYPNAKGKKVPMLTQVVAFDVLYDQVEAKAEINFLSSIINEFKMTNEDKHAFLENILQYWILSVKDSKWEQERERRYVLFLYDEYEYLETDFNDAKFLKFKTTLFLEPDFVLGPNPEKEYLRVLIDNKRKAISEHSYWFCKDCYSRDYDADDNMNCCAICGSSNIHFEEI